MNRITNTWLPCLAGLACLLGAPGGLAADGPWQSLASIREAATGAALAGLPEGNHGATAGALDSRLRLAACDGPLDTFIKGAGRGRSRITVQVSCPGPSQWKIHVPVNLTQVEPVLVLTQPVQRGQVLSADHLGTEERDVVRLSGGYFTRVGQVVGQRATRPLRAGQVLAANSLAAARLIQKGQAVTIEASGGPVSVRMAGKALADGAAGQRIKVLNLSSNRAVEAVVKSSQVVEVLLD